MADVEEAKAKAVEAATVAKAKAEEVYAKAAELGFFSHFWPEYTMELLVPGKMLMADEQLAAKPDIKEKALYMLDVVKNEVMGAITLSPPTPVPAFKLYNVIGFWLGVLESIIFAVFGHGLISLLWNGAVGFCIAYTLYWSMTCTNVQKIQAYALIFIALYIGFNIYMGISTLLYVIPACLYFGKAFCDALMLVNGYKIYTELFKENAFDMKQLL